MIALQTIGIARGLLWHRYGVLWKTFFQALGFKVVVSPATDRALFERGRAFSVDEVCLASQVYLGHVAALVGVCDVVFVPCFESGNVRAGFCTKYQSLPDMVRATFRDEPVEFLALNVADVSNKKKMSHAYVDFAVTKLGAAVPQALKAWKAAQRAQASLDDKRARAQEQAFKLIEKSRKNRTDTPLTVLLVAHPYVSHDDYIVGDIVGCLKEMGALVLYADETNHAAAFKKSFELSETLPWIINRELLGSIMLCKDKVDGIVLVSAFPCGPDSMFDDLVVRSIQDVALLNLMIDAQSGTAGVQTRLESFMDILRFQKKGSYLG